MKSLVYFSKWDRIFKAALVYLLSKISNVCCVFKFRQNNNNNYNWRDKNNKKKIVRVQYSTIGLNQKRSNTYNRSIENEM